MNHELSDEQSKIVEDFQFDEMAEKSKDQTELVKNIKSEVDDYKIASKIIKIYNEIGLLDDKHLASGFPELVANDLVGVQPMTDPATNAFFEFTYRDGETEEDEKSSSPPIL